MGLSSLFPLFFFLANLQHVGGGRRLVKNDIAGDAAKVIKVATLGGILRCGTMEHGTHTQVYGKAGVGVGALCISVSVPFYLCVCVSESVQLCLRFSHTHTRALS